MKVDAIIGLQWGDEGKGKIVDYLADQYDLVCRFQGGPNAGHTLYVEGKKYVLHTIPSGIFRASIINVIGNGVVIDPITLRREIEKLDGADVDFRDRLLVSRKAHLILPTHRMLDAASEASKGKGKIGSTLKGIGPTYMDKTGRNGLRVGDIEMSDFEEKYQTLKSKHLGLLKLYPSIDFNLDEEEAKWMESLNALKELRAIDGEYLINSALNRGQRVLAEGAQGSMLDIDYGTYPFVTSSNTISSGICNGLGVAPQRIGDIIGITKAYCTRVGSGPFPTELFDDYGEKLQHVGQEFGATTGRPRRCGWIDIPQLKYSIMLNGVTKLAVTKIDVLNEFETFQAATQYELEDGQSSDQLPFELNNSVIPIYDQFKGWNMDIGSSLSSEQLPEELMNYIRFLENSLGVPVDWISTGPGRNELIINS